MNEIINKLLNEIPLQERLKNNAMLKDKHNWVNGEYTGNIKEIEIDVAYIMEDVKKRLRYLYPEIDFSNL